MKANEIPTDLNLLSIHLSYYTLTIDMKKLPGQTRTCLLTRLQSSPRMFSMSSITRFATNFRILFNSCNSVIKAPALNLMDYQAYYKNLLSSTSDVAYKRGCEMKPENGIPQACLGRVV